MIEEYERLSQIMKQSNIDPAQIEDIQKYVLAGLQRKYQGKVSDSNLKQNSATEQNQLEQEDPNDDDQIQDLEDNVENVAENLANYQQNQLDTDSDSDDDDNQAERGTWAYFLFSRKSTLNREFYKLSKTIVGGMFKLILMFFIQLSVTICLKQIFN